MSFPDNSAPRPCPELSVIVPAFNESASLPACIAELEKVCRACSENFEILVVNDGSTDDSSSVLTSLQRSFECLRPVILSRNFGKEAAMLAGLSSCHGRAAVLIDADLQHPPEIIPEMIGKWRDGFAVVHGVKRSRRDGWLYLQCASLFNRLMSSAVGRDFQGASDFKLLDRKVIQAVLQCGETQRFFRGLVAWVGFRECAIEFDVQERKFGHSTWNTRSLIRYSIRNILVFSSLPLRMVAAAGFITVALGVLLGLYTLGVYFAGVALSGFSTVIVAIVFFSGMILVALGVIAAYLAMIYDELKRRPVFLVDSNPDNANR